jgi:DNA repair protein RadC
MAGKTVLQMADELLNLPGTGGLAGLLAASYQDLRAVKGLGPAKRAELMAVLELARRATAQQLRERDVFGSPEAVTHFCSYTWPPSTARCLPCCFWTVRTG